MRKYSLAAIATAGLLASAGAPAEAVLYQIQVATFVVPVNLTNLSPSLAKVGVRCYVSGRDSVLVETPVVDGKVNTVLEVKVPLPESRGVPVPYVCHLIFFGLPGSATEGGRQVSGHMFSEKEFQITPLPDNLYGDIVW